MTYNEALRHLMHEKGVEQVDLARAIGRSRSYVSQLMSGKVKEPTLSAAFAIADALGVTVQDFLDLMHGDEQAGQQSQD